MPHQNPARMAPEEIVREIRTLQSGIEQHTMRISELSLSLYSRARRRKLALPGQEEPKDTVPYIVFANSWARMSSSLRNGVQRMARTDRVFTRHTTPDLEETPKRERPAVLPVLAPEFEDDDPMEDLVSLYGGEVVNDARPR